MESRIELGMQNKNSYGSEVMMVSEVEEEKDYYLKFRYFFG